VGGEKGNAVSSAPSAGTNFMGGQNEGTLLYHLIFYTLLLPVPS
jgi:hypothetical protein